jgi:hypothetical protein
MTRIEHNLILEQSHWRPPVKSTITQKLFDLVNMMAGWNPESRASTDLAMQAATSSGLIQFIKPHSPVLGSKRQGDEIHRETT